MPPTHLRDAVPRAGAWFTFSAAKAHVGVYGLVHLDGNAPAEDAAWMDHLSTWRFRLDRLLPAAGLAAAIRQTAGTL